MVQGTSSKGYANQEPIRPGPKGGRQGLSEELGEEEPRGRTETSTDADRTSSRSEAGDQRVDDKVGGAQGQVQPERRGTVNSETSSTSTGPGKDSEGDGDHMEPEEFHDCFEEHSEERWRCDVRNLENKAKQAKRDKDFSFETAAQVIKELARHGSNDRHRQCVPKAGHVVALGAYSYGAFHGVNNKTLKFPRCSLYLNAWAKDKGFKGSWTSISVAVNVGHALHRDSNNLPGSANQSISFGDFTGGRLWLEQVNEPTHDQNPENFQKILTKNQEVIPGYYQSY